MQFLFFLLLTANVANAESIAEWTKNLEKEINKTSSESAPFTIKVTEEEQKDAFEVVNAFEEKVKQNFKITTKLERTEFLIFGSFSMGLKNLEKLIESAKRYDGIVVLRGFKEGSIKKTYGDLFKIIEKTGGGLVIDPTLFAKYGIKTVPSFVLATGCDDLLGVSCQEKYDTLRGNVSPRFALEKFSQNGDLREEARRKL